MVMQHRSLNSEQAKAILYACLIEGRKRQDLANEYRVSLSTIRSIVTGEKYMDVYILFISEVLLTVQRALVYLNDNGTVDKKVLGFSRHSIQEKEKKDG